MRIIVVDNYEEMSKKAAAMVASQVILKPDSVLGLATGDTPIGMYKEIINIYKNQKMDFSKARTFNLDEYYGLNRENPQSYYYYMMNNLFNHVNIDKNNINIPNGMADNIEIECKEYERKIDKAGGIDLQILGIGVNGHIGFNEPNISFESETHLVNLNEKTIESNSRFFSSKEEVPTKAISVGIKSIIHSKKIILLACGSAKSDAVSKTINGKINPNIPASILQLHRDVVVIIDKEAASKLNLK
ncbi:glucosamine-6-phosphate deaminase [Clostridium botulinum]|uniref:Glucosamine-6-phosphate deaminase n=4 Tax=Clostridium botulinum TaxID=1491 RepID=NAGB_CLOBH|nr:glucosamine-6-phosphate deaminase [Clostridium botulinum]A5I5R9.1 RecName: Full=Glucosamine-6-phosphate deaminase; AltName: Full=GlcN6P deaminase; Short=GNPDA; AltName: Full=Glucosamine-6-phosphate isomerase [Clostridium botulinum A str. Hall]A7FX73.1 RecName: Full=Glucosamine-6-phosphate deaminase; AltName: Full=GlcN6P deaminase; Short=GNPDA; AltName: Full=Glucosamine-6-phosphate isomerase [Clostridium botulinum A str. ATCC 19397]EPS48559.1 glucosamine-6-phosphate deaminase [Clostridium botu